MELILTKSSHHLKGRILKKYNLNFGKDDVIIGILARLHPVKGIGTLLQAARLIVDENPSVRFLIGGGWGRKKVFRKKGFFTGAK